MSPFLPEVLAAWVARLGAEGPWRALAGLGVGLVAYALLKRGTGLPARARAPIVALLAAGAVAAAARRASVVDDAFIALRYARNLVEGKGLVYNVGERVEGFTDLLWVLLVAAGNVLTGVELPLVALVLNLVIVAANVAVAADTGRRLGAGAPSRGALPLGAILLAGHAVFVAHGTTGLETGLLALLVQLALRSLVGPAGPRSAAWAGAWLVLATLCRPDAALFLPIAAIALAARERRRGVVRAWAALAAPGVLLVAVQAWRVAYYGDWFPNTAYAKAAGGAYWSQGFVYAAEFWLGSASWPFLFATLGWCVFGRGPVAARIFVGLGVVLHTTYVTRIGGDFMSGRFYVVLLPLLALATEQAWRALRGAGARAALLGVVAAGLGSGSLLGRKSIEWYIADEGTVYPVKRWSPLRIDHPSWRIGNTVGKTLADRGITPVVAAGTIGMLGYYGRLPLIDLHGLTDRYVARTVVAERGHIGHEKEAPSGYLRKRGVKLVQARRHCASEQWRGLRGVEPPTGHNPKKPWCFLQWDPALAARLRRDAPGWKLPDPEAFLDTYVAALPQRAPADVAKDLRFLERYFAKAPRPAQLDAIAAYAGVAKPAAPTPAAPTDPAGAEPAAQQGYTPAP